MFWNLAKEQFEEPIERDGKIRSISFDPDGRKIVIGSWGDSSQHNTQYFDLSTRTEFQGDAVSFDANVGKFGGSGRYLILSRDHPGATKTADISLFDAQSNEICLELKNSDNHRFGYGVDRFALSPDNRILALFVHAGSGDAYDAMIFAWDLSTKKLLWKRRAHDKPIHSLEFSPNGKLLVSTSDDHTIKFWEPSRGTYIRTLKGHRSLGDGIHLFARRNNLGDSKHGRNGSLMGCGKRSRAVRVTRRRFTTSMHRRFRRTGTRSLPETSTEKIWVWHAGTGTRDHK